MRKGLFASAILAGGLVFSLVGCGGNNKPVVDDHVYTISIDNKTELQAEWLSDDPSRNINLTITKDGVEQNATAAVNKGEVTFTVSDPEVVRVQGRQATPVGEGSATITANYFKASDSVNVTVTYSDPHGKSADDPLSVAEAVALCNSLESGALTTIEYYTSGVVSNVGDPYSEQYGNITFDIVDSLTDTSKFVRCYRVVPVEGATFDCTKIERGSEILMKGYLQNYNGNLPEYPKGSEILSATEGLQPQVIPINVAGALAVAMQLADNTTSFDKYEITGYITAVKQGSGFYMSDTKGAVDPSQDQFLVYYGSGTMPEDATVNAKVKVLAKLKHYVSTSSSAYAYETAGNAPEQYTLLESGDTPVVDPEDYMAIVALPEVGTKYKLGVKVSERGDKGDLFLTGKLSGAYLETTHDYTKGADFELVRVSDSRTSAIFNLKVTYSDETSKFVNIAVSGDKNNLSLDDTASTQYVYNTSANTLYAELNGHTTATKDGYYYMGTYGTYTTISISAASYIEGDNASKIDVSQFPVHFCTKGEKPQPVELTGVEVSPKTAEVNLNGKTEAQTVKLTAKALPEKATLPENLVWSSDNDKVSVDKGVVSIPADLVAEGGDAVEVKVTVSTGLGGFSDVATITVKNEAEQGEKLEVAIAATSFAADAENSKLATFTSGIATFTLDQHNSTTANRLSDSDHLRVYKNAKFTTALSSGSITKIEITCTAASYAVDTNFSETGGTVTVADTVVTVTLAAGAASLSFVAANQVRINNIVIYYAA